MTQNKTWGYLNVNKKPRIHVPDIGVEYGNKTTLWYKRKGEPAPPGTPEPGTLTENDWPDDVIGPKDVIRV